MKEEIVPNELLRRARCLKGWSQDQLAEQVGTVSTMVSRWERGINAPSPYFRERLCAVLGKSAEELGLVRESHLPPKASLTELSPLWNVPYPRNPFFTGREEILEVLHQCLAGEQTVALTQSYALQGLGGIGKTHLAVEYTYRHSQDYAAIFWIAAEKEETILSSFVAVAELLQLPERQEADQQKIVAGVQRWLNTHSQWLLIWDNVEDLGLLQRFLPATRAGAILMTTRRQSLGTLAQGIELPTMTPQEGLLLLFRRAKMLRSQATQKQVDLLSQQMPKEYQAAQQLVAAMDGLPLAIDQAGAYIEETPCSLTDYLELFQTRSAQLLRRRGEAASEHPASVVATWSLSFEKVEQANPASAELLRLCAFLHPDAIPEEILMQAITPPDEQAGATDHRLQLHEALARLLAYSLLRRQMEERTCSIHRLVQAVLTDSMDVALREQWMKKAVSMVHAVFPEVEHSTWSQCERLVPHALICASHIVLWEQGNIDLASLLFKTATYLYKRGQLGEAEPLFQRVLHTFEQVLGPEHPTLAYSLNGLARLYNERGQFAEAEPLFQRALHILEQALGPDHPDVAVPLYGLGRLYGERGQHAEAEPLLQRAWHISERALGSEHPNVATPLHYLAILYWIQGRYQEAEPLFQRALHILEQASGPEHPDVAHLLDSLAILYYEQGKCAEAEALFQRAWYIFEQELGSEHFLVGTVLDNLADLYRRQNKYTEAEAFYQRALHICEQALGSTHYSVAEVLYGLAELYRAQGRYEEAEPLYQQSMHIAESGLFPEHPAVAYPLNGLANCYSEQGKYAQAEPLFQRAFAIREHALGAHHPETAESLHDFAVFQQAQGNRDEAVLSYQRALAIREQALGPDHPKTQQTKKCYASLLGSLSQSPPQSST